MSKPEATQTNADHYERLKAMAFDRGETWDLSDKDQAAIRFALLQCEAVKPLVDQITKLKQEIAEQSLQSQFEIAGCYSRCLHFPESIQRLLSNLLFEFCDLVDYAEAYHREAVKPLVEALEAIVASAHNGNEPGQTWIMIAGGLIDDAEAALSHVHSFGGSPAFT